jgi:hypothetical protein
VNTIDRQRAWLETTAREHWPPLAIMSAPITLAVAVWVSESWLFALVLSVPITAAAVGFALRPRRVWVVWLGSVVIQWIAMGAFGRYGDPEPEETTASLMLEALIWMALGVALPLWLGRVSRGGVPEWLKDDDPMPGGKSP